MKKGLLLIIVSLLISSLGFSQTTIADARAAAEGTVVTVTGIALNGAELGIIRYIQDGTAGIAAYGASLADVQQGDNVTITGTTKLYKQLLELDPVTSVVINSSGNALPAAQVITPSQVGEAYEAELVTIQNGTFAAGTFAEKTNYDFTSGGQVIIARTPAATGGSDLIGAAIPTNSINITTIVGQYHADNPAAGYQLLLRTSADFTPGTVGISAVNNGMKVYPNPVTNILNIVSVSNVKVMNLAGQIVINAENASSIDMSSLNAGMYLVSIQNENGTSVAKVIKK